MKKIKALNEALEQFDLATKVLKEEYGISREEEPLEGEYAEPEPEEEAAYEQEQESKLSSGDERITQIREIALDGLQDYADDVDGAPYQFFKKIWLMCDKTVSEKENSSENN